MPSLYELVSDVANAYQRARDSGDSGDADTFRLALRQLTSVLGDVAAQAKDLGTARHDAAVKSIDSKTAIDDSVGLGLFFQQIGQAVISSQQDLDRKSVAYNESLSPEMPRTFYSIPNVKAEIKVGFSQLGTKGLNVVVFQNSDQKQNYSESTVTFDIVASPGLPSAPLPAPAGVVKPVALKTPGIADENLEGGLAIDEDELEGGIVAERDEIETESAPIPEKLKFPLAGEQKESILRVLASLVADVDRTVLTSGEAPVSILPSNPDPNKVQPYLALCAGSKAQDAGPALRAVRAYYGHGSPREFLLQTRIYTYRRPVENANGVLFVPPLSERNEWAATSPEQLRYLARNLGDVLMTIILHGRNFAPPFVLQGRELQRVVKSVSDAFPRNRQLAGAFREDSILVRQRQTYVSLRAVTPHTDTEWTELFVGLLKQKDGAFIGKPLALHIPPVERLIALEKRTPRQLLTLTSGLENLLAALIELLERP